jgi:RES domain-containing protein
MLVYRIHKKKFALISGEGARLTGGRWNSVGMPCIYASALMPMSILEYLSHLEDFGLVPSEPMEVVAIRVNEAKLIKIKPSQLPLGWNRPLNLQEAQRMGDSILKRKDKHGFIIPSAILPTEINVVLNSAVQNWNQRIVKRIEYRPYGI